MEVFGLGFALGLGLVLGVGGIEGTGPLPYPYPYPYPYPTLARRMIARHAASASGWYLWQRATASWLGVGLVLG